MTDRQSWSPKVRNISRARTNFSRSRDCVSSGTKIRSLKRQKSSSPGLPGRRAMDAWNYFTYFTEIEEYFWKKRGSHLLVSPLDWAIMETWQKAGVPLEAAFKGIDKAFESYGRSRRGAGKPLKSLAYCTGAVLQVAEEGLEAAAGSAAKNGRGAK